MAFPCTYSYMPILFSAPTNSGRGITPLKRTRALSAHDVTGEDRRGDQSRIPFLRRKRMATQIIAIPRSINVSESEMDVPVATAPTIIAAIENNQTLMRSIPHTGISKTEWPTWRGGPERDIAPHNALNYTITVRGAAGRFNRTGYEPLPRSPAGRHSRFRVGPNCLPGVSLTYRESAPSGGGTWHGTGKGKIVGRRGTS